MNRWALAGVSSGVKFLVSAVGCTECGIAEQRLLQAFQSGSSDQKNGVCLAEFTYLLSRGWRLHAPQSKR